MDFNDLLTAAKGKIVQLREIVVEPVPLHQVEGKRVLTHPLRLQLARGLMVIGLITTVSGLVMFFTAPASKKSAERGHQIELLQLEQELKPMPPEEYKRRFEEIVNR